MTAKKDAWRAVLLLSRHLATGGSRKGPNVVRGGQPKPTQGTKPPVRETQGVPKEIQEKVGATVQPPLPVGVDKLKTEGSTPGPVLPEGHPSSNPWLFSPSLPVDVRLLAAATIGLGGVITYAYFSKVEEFEHSGGVARDLGLGADGGVQHRQPETADVPPGEMASQSSFYTDELALEASSPQQESIQQAASQDKAAPTASSRLPPSESSSLQHEQGDVALLQAPESNEPDSEAVAQLLHSVLVDRIDIPAAAADGSTGSHPSSPDDVSGRDGGDGGSSTGGAGSGAAREKLTAAEETLQQTLNVLKEGVAGSSGEAVLSSAAAQAQLSARKASSANTRNPGQPEDEPASGSPDAAEAAKQRLGISEDLRPAALMRKAIERGEGSGDKWEDFGQRLAQAAADADTFQIALQQAASARQAELDRLSTEQAKREEIISVLERTVKDQASTFKEILRQEGELAAQQREGELARQAEYLAAAYAEAAVSERANRASALDQVRLKLNGLLQAFNRRGQERAVSHDVHKLSLGLFALESALEKGGPFVEEAELLRQSCPEDPLVAAALTTLPEGLAQQGVATKAHLLERWPAVCRLSGQLSYLPAGQTGLIQLGLASLAARLKVREVALEGTPQTVDQALAHAGSCLVQGRVAEAASIVEKHLAGTAAAGVVSEWIEEARAHAVAEQAVRLLQAHATAKEASLT